MMGKGMSKSRKSNHKSNDEVAQITTPIVLDPEKEEEEADDFRDMMRRVSEFSLQFPTPKSSGHNNHSLEIDPFLAYTAPSRRASVGKSVDLMLITQGLPIINRPIRVPLSSKQATLASDSLGSSSFIVPSKQSKSVPTVNVNIVTADALSSTSAISSQLDINANVPLKRMNNKQHKKANQNLIVYHMDQESYYEKMGDTIDNDMYSEKMKTCSKPETFQSASESSTSPPSESVIHPSATRSITYTALNNWAEPDDSSKIPNSSTSTDTSASLTSTKKKLIVRGLKNFVHSRGGGSHPPSWLRDFPCKSKFHPDNYVYDWEKGVPKGTHQKQSVQSGGKISGRCGGCGIYSADSCRCCKKCPFDCACPKPPSRVPDVMSQAFGPGWTQAQKVICEMTGDERRAPIGGNPTKMNEAFRQNVNYPPPHLKCHMDILNPSRDPVGYVKTEPSPPRFNSNYYTPQAPCPPPYGYFQPQPPMYTGYYPPPPMMPAYMSMPPPSYQTPCYPNYLSYPEQQPNYYSR